MKTNMALDKEYLISNKCFLIKHPKIITIIVAEMLMYFLGDMKDIDQNYSIRFQIFPISVKIVFLLIKYYYCIHFRPRVMCINSKV